MHAGIEIITNANRFFSKCGSKLPEHPKPTDVKKVQNSSFLNQICSAFCKPVLTFWINYCSVDVLK